MMNIDQYIDSDLLTSNEQVIFLLRTTYPVFFWPTWQKSNAIPEEIMAALAIKGILGKIEKSSADLSPSSGWQPPSPAPNQPLLNVCHCKAKIVCCLESIFWLFCNTCSDMTLQFVLNLQTKWPIYGKSDRSDKILLIFTELM